MPAWTFEFFLQANGSPMCCWCKRGWPLQAGKMGGPCRTYSAWWMMQDWLCVQSANMSSTCSLATG